MCSSYGKRSSTRWDQPQSRGRNRAWRLSPFWKSSPGYCSRMQCHHQPTITVTTYTTTPHHSWLSLGGWQPPPPPPRASCDRNNTMPRYRPSGASFLRLSSSAALSSPRTIRTAASPPLSSLQRHPHRSSILFVADHLRLPCVLPLSAPVAPFIPDFTSKIFAIWLGQF